MSRFLSVRASKIVLVVLWCVCLSAPIAYSETPPKPINKLKKKLESGTKKIQLDLGSSCSLLRDQKTEAIIISTIEHGLSVYRKQHPSIKTKKPINDDVSERKFMEAIHFYSHCSFPELEEFQADPRISIEELYTKISSRRQKSKTKRRSEIISSYFNLLSNGENRLLQLYPNLPYLPLSTTNVSNASYIKKGNLLLTPGLASMWNHCKRRFERYHPNWTAKIVSGFHSKAYQFSVFVSSSHWLPSAVKKNAPPGSSGHELRIPDISIKLTSKHKSSQAPPWEKFHQECSEFGFKPRYPKSDGLQGETQFEGIQSLYEPIFANELVPSRVGRDLYRALHKTQFFPSPQGMRIILALSAQESTIQWNPKLNKQKKNLLRKRFVRILSRIQDIFPETVSEFLLKDSDRKKLDDLIMELNQITDQNNQKTREYDFYLWSRKTYSFIEKLTSEYRQIYQVGQWLFNLEAVKKQLKNEPQTFGLWQVNVNHLIEKIESFKQLRRAFPQIYKKADNSYQVDRSWLIDALSGRPGSRLTRQQTIELLIHTYLRPKYENHHLGDRTDLRFFAAENMAGEMSTFRAPIQKALNQISRSRLRVDGDLTYYLPYSTKINWTKPSQTYQKLKDFVHDHRYYFKEPVNPNKLLNDLCSAKSWSVLSETELYQKLMNKSYDERIYPEIKSKLYNQTPEQYADLVVRKSKLF